MENVILHVNNLTVSFGKEKNRTVAVDNISFKLNTGEILGIVGESGSGKSVTSLSIMNLIQSPPGNIDSGKILYQYNNDLVDLLDLNEKNLCSLRGNEIAMVFQEPMTSLNPSHKCGKQVAESLFIHKNFNEKEAHKEVIRLFEKVKLPDPNRIYNSYPHQLSGGQIQRVMIAMAICCQPAILIADEPTTALDVTVQKSILGLIKEIKQELNSSIIFISHDLGVIKEIADKVIVMQKGKIVEEGYVNVIFNSPVHPYTRGLLACRPPLKDKMRRLPTVEDFLNKNNQEQKLFLKSLVIGNDYHKKRIVAINNSEILLEVVNAKKYYPAIKNWYGKALSYTKAVNGVNLKVRKGEVLGLVGESGCGKSTLGKCILKLEQLDEGKVFYEGKDLNNHSSSELKNLRQKIQIIFQDPYSSLNPRMKIGKAIVEPMVVHKLYGNMDARKEKAIELMEMVGLSADHYNRYPHEFSGGQRQRICIARSLSLQPQFLLCDESVSALDVSVQAQVLNLLSDLKEKYDLSLIFISHDLSVIKHISDYIAVMKEGKIVEYGVGESIFNNPKEKYTQQLIEALPSKDFSYKF